jgi:ankyrin repeat protein
MFHSRLASLSVLALLSSVSALADCPMPIASVQRIFDLVEAKKGKEAIEAIMYADVSVNTDTRNVKCETIYHVAYRTEQKELLSSLEKMGLGIKDPNARDPKLGVSLAEYVFRFGSLPRIRAALENGVNLPAYPGSERNLVNTLIAVSNAGALQAMVKDGTFTIREMAGALVAFREKSMDERARFSSLLDARMIAFVGTLRTELHSKDVVAKDAPLATVLAALESGDKPADIRKAYLRQAAKLSPSYAQELNSELSRLLGSRNADAARVRELVTEYGLDWTKVGYGGAESVVTTAIAYGNVEVLRFLLSQSPGQEVARDTKRGDAFRSVIESGNVEMLKIFLAAGADPSKRIYRGHPIELAVSARKPDMQKALLAAGSKHDAQAETQAMSMAVGSGSAELVQILVGAGVSANLPSGTNASTDSPLCSAAQAGRTDVVKVLLAAKADFYAGRRTAVVCAIRGRQTDIARTLIAAGADPKVKSSDGETSLLAAVESGNRQMVDLLVAAKCDPNEMAATDRSGVMLPLELAVASDQLEVARTLILAGADVNAKLDSRDYPTVLFDAVDRENLDMVKLLVDAKARLDLQAARGALEMAIHDRNLDMLKLLISVKVPLDQLSLGQGGSMASNYGSYQATALHHAIRLTEESYGQDEDELKIYAAMVRELVKAGASKRVKDSKGRTPGSYASFKVWGPYLPSLRF